MKQKMRTYGKVAYIISPCIYWFLLRRDVTARPEKLAHAPTPWPSKHSQHLSYRNIENNPTYLNTTKKLSNSPVMTSFPALIPKCAAHAIVSDTPNPLLLNFAEEAYYPIYLSDHPSVDCFSWNSFFIGFIAF